ARTGTEGFLLPSLPTTGREGLGDADRPRGGSNRLPARDLIARRAYLAAMTETLDAAPEALDQIPRAPTQDGPAVRLYIVDGSGFIFRAFHALPPLTRKTDGLPVGAVSGFCNMLWKLLVDMKAAPDAPTHLA